MKGNSLTRVVGDKEMIDLSLIFNIMSIPLGLVAVYYGYLAYKHVKGGLRAYYYFFFAMLGLGGVIALNIVRLLDILPKNFSSLEGLLLVIIALFFMLTFKDLHEFMSKAF